MFLNPNLSRQGGGLHNTVDGNQYNTNNNTNNYANYTNDSPSDILRTLADRAACDATWNAEARSPTPKCHPNTRVDTLNWLEGWINGRESGTRVCWIRGSVGVGKSAIAQKVSEDHRDRLVGTFFFSRVDPERNRLDRFVATIAYQCCTLPGLRKVVGPMIIDAIRSDPNVFTTSADAQFEKLILEPFSKVNVFHRRRKLPNLLVIDGLDECDHSPPRDLEALQKIFRLAVTFRTRTPFIFLLCSRPDVQIYRLLDDANLKLCLHTLELSSGMTICFPDQSSESDLDIQRYFVDEFARIRRNPHNTLVADGKWPKKEEVDGLVRRASGQFIFAVTVIKYIDTDSEEETPQVRLRAILRTEPTGPGRENGGSLYPALDGLYEQILSKCLNWDNRVCPILSLLATPFPDFGYHSPTTLRWFSASNIATLLGRELGPEDVITPLSKLHSVIHVPGDVHTDIRILHASFIEFLSDHARSKKYYAQYPAAKYCELVTVFSLRKLSSFNRHYPLHCMDGPESSNEDGPESPNEGHSNLRDKSPALTSRNLPESGLYSGRQKISPITGPLSDRSLSSSNERSPSQIAGSSKMVHVLERWGIEVSREKYETSFFADYWAKYCCEVESPGPRLKAELDGFDPYTVGALALAYRHDVATLFNTWRDCLQWAKSHEEMSPFVKTMEIFFQACYIGYQKECWNSSLDLIVLTFQVESCLPRDSLTSKDLKQMSTIIAQYYRQWWNQRSVGNDLPPVWRPLLLPVTFGSERRVSPEELAEVQVTETNGEMLRKLHRIRNDLDSDDQKLFDNDVIVDTSETVSKKLVKKEDLAAYKALLYGRRELFENLRHTTMPASETSETKERHIRTETPQISEPKLDNWVLQCFWSCIGGGRTTNTEV